MEGLEITEELSQVCFNVSRLDSNYFAHPDHVHINNILSEKQFIKLNDIVDYISSGHTPYKHDMISGDIAFITVECVGDMQLNKSKLKKITTEQFNKEFIQNRIIPESVVCTIKRRICKAYPFLLDSDNMAMNQDIAFLIPKPVIDSAYLAAYFNSKYGQMFADKLKTEQMNPYISVENLSQLPIYLATHIFQQEIRQLVISAQNISQETENLYSEAEDILLNELGLNDWVPTNQSSTTKSFADFLGSGRLDAEYYQPKYDEIEKQIANYGGDNIDQLFELKDKNFIPKNDVQYKYIELSNIGGNGEITGCSYEYGSDLPSRARRKVNTGDVIVSSIEGSLQSCAVITEEYNNSLCSNGFYVLAPKMISAETSLILFKSAPIQQLMKKVCSGTILTAMNKDEFVNIPIPIIAEDIQQQITDKVQKSFELRAESKRLLGLAKTAVEIAIEQGEQKALELLKQN